MEIKSNVGFYVGDVTFVLGDKTYHNYWKEFSDLLSRAEEISDSSLEKEALTMIESWGHGHEHTLRVPNSDLTFSVAYTDGSYGERKEEYKDNEGNTYIIAEGVIGVVPLELVENEQGLQMGGVFKTPGTSIFEGKLDLFHLLLPGKRLITITPKQR